MMFIVQILLPLYDNEGDRFDADDYIAVRTELTRQYGGLTAYSRSPADGLWETDAGVKKDEIIVFEVMVDEVKEQWWRQYRTALEKRFRQDFVLIRVLECRIV